MAEQKTDSGPKLRPPLGPAKTYYLMSYGPSEVGEIVEYCLEHHLAFIEHEAIDGGGSCYWCIAVRSEYKEQIKAHFKLRDAQFMRACRLPEGVGFLNYRSLGEVEEDW